MWIVTTREGLSFPRMSYAYATQLAIYRYHASGSETAALQYLSQTLDRFHLTNTSRVDEAEEDLRNYILWCVDEQPIVTAWRIRIEFNIGSGWFLGGDVSRIDVDGASGYYKAILLGGRKEYWYQELRMPLLQRAVGIKLERLTEEIVIGVQDLDGRNIEQLQFSESEIQEAVEEAKALAERLYTNW